MPKKTDVISLRVNERLHLSLDKIAEQYNITTSHLIFSVLSSFVDEYSKSLVEGFSINENEEDAY